MPKLIDYGEVNTPDHGVQRRLVFFCPGCGYDHCYDTPRWGWNGDMEKPTFTPSLDVNRHSQPHHCHLFVINGEIRYCEDSHHVLKGKVVPMVDVSPE